MTHLVSFGPGFSRRNQWKWRSCAWKQRHIPETSIFSTKYMTSESRPECWNKWSQLYFQALVVGISLLQTSFVNLLRTVAEYEHDTGDPRP